MNCQNAATFLTLGQVAVADRIRRQPPDAGVVEDRLGDDDTPQHPGDGQCDEVDRGDQRIWHHMAAHHPAEGHALQFRHADVVRGHHVDQA